MYLTRLLALCILASTLAALPTPSPPTNKTECDEAVNEENKALQAEQQAQSLATVAAAVANQAAVTAAQQAARVDRDRATAFAAIANEVCSAEFRKERARKA
ncbi:hypothetical protein V8E51_008631 [Hyaloscypha variabilis]